MPYATATNTILNLPVFPQTATTANFTNTVAVVNSHITRAETIINGKISSRYFVSTFQTSTTLPPLLTTLTEDIAGYYTIRSFFSADNQNVNEWGEKFQEAMELLEDIRDGKMDLVGPDLNIISGTSTTMTVESSTQDFSPTFSEDDILQSEVDQDKFPGTRTRI